MKGIRTLAVLSFVALRGVLCSAGESTSDIYAGLTNAESGIVRATVMGLAGSKDPKTPARLIDFYKNGQTYDAWSFHIKIEILNTLEALRAHEALPLCLAEFVHPDDYVFAKAVQTAATIATPADRKAVAARLLAVATTNRDVRKVVACIEGLGRLQSVEAVPWIGEAYHRTRFPADVSADWVVAHALADIGKPACLPLLMEIYLAQPSREGAPCIDAADAFLQCLGGLCVSSGKDFPDDPKAWQKWYEEEGKDLVRSSPGVVPLRRPE